MKNEEKAREIAEHNQCEYPFRGHLINTSINECEDSALEMAKWKDAQLNEELNLIIGWFNHIAQIADDKKTLNGVVMKDSDAFDEIKCLAKESAEYVTKRLLNI